MLDVRPAGGRVIVVEREAILVIMPLAGICLSERPPIVLSGTVAGCEFTDVS